MDAASLYNSRRLAEGYAHARPSVHPRIIDVVRRRFAELGIESGQRGLDVGCGTGLSTIALAPLAARIAAVDPAIPMLRHGAQLAPDAWFVAARAEELPFRDGSFDVLAAAGSLNYTDLGRVLPELARVMTDEGILLVYDFSSGRRLAEDRRLDRWFGSFEQRYPFPPGYEMDVKSLDFAESGLRLVRFEEFHVAVPMTGPEYLAYALTETNVEQAIASGVSEDEVRRWCQPALEDIFGDAARDVLFDGYVAYVRPSLPSAA